MPRLPHWPRPPSPVSSVRLLDGLGLLSFDVLSVYHFVWRFICFCCFLHFFEVILMVLGCLWDVSCNGLHRLLLQRCSFGGTIGSRPFGFVFFAALLEALQQNKGSKSTRRLSSESITKPQASFWDPGMRPKVIL